jgi:hypothetical protein
VARQPKRNAIARESKRPGFGGRCRRRGARRRRPRRHRRAAATTCGWCGGAIEIKATGRIPKWCSAACRQRAWEQSRAAASGRSAVEVVERVIEVPVARERTPWRDEWPALLRELGGQLDADRIYARGLPGLGAALDDLVAAYNRRQNPRRMRR